MLGVCEITSQRPFENLGRQSLCHHPRNKINFENYIRAITNKVNRMLRMIKIGFTCMYIVLHVSIPCAGEALARELYTGLVTTQTETH